MSLFTKAVVRQATEADAEAVYEAEKYWAGVPGRLVTMADEMRVEIFTRLIARSINAKNDRFLVVVHKNKVVGHAFIEGLRGRAIQHIGYLTIVMHPDHTGKGHGSLLIGTLLNWARKESDLLKIELLVRSTNTQAQKLYLKLGFKEEGRFIKRLQIQAGVFIDDILMGMWLDK